MENRWRYLNDGTKYVEKHCYVTVDGKSYDGTISYFQKNVHTGSPACTVVSIGLQIVDKTYVKPRFYFDGTKNYNVNKDNFMNDLKTPIHEVRSYLQ